MGLLLIVVPLVSAYSTKYNYYRKGLSPFFGSKKKKFEYLYNSCVISRW